MTYLANPCDAFFSRKATHNWCTGSGERSGGVCCAKDGCCELNVPFVASAGTFIGVIFLLMIWLGCACCVRCPNPYHRWARKGCAYIGCFKTKTATTSSFLDFAAAPNMTAPSPSQRAQSMSRFPTSSAAPPEKRPSRYAEGEVDAAPWYQPAEQNAPVSKGPITGVSPQTTSVSPISLRSTWQSEIIAQPRGSEHQGINDGAFDEKFTFVDAAPMTTSQQVDIAAVSDPNITAPSSQQASSMYGFTASPLAPPEQSPPRYHEGELGSTPWYQPPAEQNAPVFTGPITGASRLQTTPVSPVPTKNTWQSQIRTQSRGSEDQDIRDEAIDEMFNFYDTVPTVPLNVDVRAVSNITASSSQQAPSMYAFPTSESALQENPPPRFIEGEVDSTPWYQPAELKSTVHTGPVTAMSPQAASASPVSVSSTWQSDIRTEPRGNESQGIRDEAIDEMFNFNGTVPTMTSHVDVTAVSNITASSSRHAPSMSGFPASQSALQENLPPRFIEGEVDSTPWYQPAELKSSVYMGPVTAMSPQAASASPVSVSNTWQSQIRTQSRGSESQGVRDEAIDEMFNSLNTVATTISHRDVTNDPIAADFSRQASPTPELYRNRTLPKDPQTQCPPLYSEVMERSSSLPTSGAKVDDPVGNSRVTKKEHKAIMDMRNIQRQQGGSLVYPPGGGITKMELQTIMEKRRASAAAKGFSLPM